MDLMATQEQLAAQKTAVRDAAAAEEMAELKKAYRKMQRVQLFSFGLNVGVEAGITLGCVALISRAVSLPVWSTALAVYGGAVLLRMYVRSLRRPVPAQQAVPQLDFDLAIGAQKGTETAHGLGQYL